MKVVRRPEAERKRLPPELEAYARGETERPRFRKPTAPALDDPRSVYLISGVANRHARAAAEAALSALQTATEAHKKGQKSDLGLLLADAIRLRVWRGKSLTSFEALTEGFLDLPGDEALKIAESTGLSLEPLDDRRAALVLRMRGAVAEEGVQATVGISADSQRITFETAPEEAAKAFAAVGKALAPLAVARKEGGRPEGKSHSGDQPRSPRPRTEDAQPPSRPRGGGQPGGFGPRKKLR